MPALDTVLMQTLEQLEASHLKRTLKSTRREDAVIITRHGKQLISFGCNNYLGLTHHPDVIRAAQDAAAEHGAGGGASRLISGNSPLYRELETRLATLKGTDAACVFGSGHLGNVGVIEALMGTEDIVLFDRLAHASLVDGALHCGAKWFRFKHNDVEDCERLLHKHRHNARHCLVMTDGVFSMDGDLAPLAELSELCQRYDAWLLCDDAHGLGVLADGRGSGFKDGAKIPVDVHMGTLSKSAGSYGGYVCGSHTLIEYLHNMARTLIYSTALPPSVLAASCAALDIIAGDTKLTTLPIRKARLFTETLGLPESESPIVLVIFGDAEEALKASQYLEEQGFLVPAIRPPTVPEGTARLRFSFSAAHTDKDIQALAALVRQQAWLGRTSDEMAEE